MFPGCDDECAESMWTPSVITKVPATVTGRSDTRPHVPGPFTAASDPCAERQGSSPLDSLQSFHPTSRFGHRNSNERREGARDLPLSTAQPIFLGKIATHSFGHYKYLQSEADLDCTYREPPFVAPLPFPNTEAPAIKSTRRRCLRRRRKPRRAAPR